MHYPPMPSPASPPVSNRPAIAQINHSHLLHNYALLKVQADSADIMAVVKANAYGHGMESIAATLSHAGCTHFAVTDASEGLALRQHLDMQHASDQGVSSLHNIEITLLSGLFSSDDAAFACNAALTPIITEPRHINWLQSAHFHGHVWIKIDSGMNRMGAADPATLLTQCREAEINVCGLMSHLSCADEPEHPMNRLQLETFSQHCEEIDPALPRSLLNSAGMMIMPEHAMHTVRPGIALYGIEPVKGKTLGLKPVMSLLGSIMQLRDIPAGAAVSYGATFIAPKPMRLATVSLGYADGVPRGLSGIGSVCINGEACPIIGRICMDYTMVDVSHIDCALGDFVEFWGEQHPANSVASQLDTISYTLFTGVGARVQRVNGI